MAFFKKVLISGECQTHPYKPKIIQVNKKVLIYLHKDLLK